MLNFAFKIISLGITTCFCILMGKITREDRIVIKTLRVEKNWSSRRFLKEFASKAWYRASLDRLIKKIDAGLLPVDGVIGRIRRQPRPVRTAANVARVEELICSQEDAPGTHKSPGEMWHLLACLL